MSKLIGTNPNQVPTNADLGTMAYLDAETEISRFIGGRKNLIINGAMQVWQRGTTLSSYGYIADRFRMSVYSGSVDSSRVTSGLDEFYYAYRMTNNTGVIEFEHRLEGSTIPNNADFMTLSFWVRGNKTGTVRTGRIINGNTGTTNLGYGYVDVTTEWKKVSVTSNNCPSADPSQYYRVFVLDDIANYLSSASDWLEITGVQLELGKVATPFEHRSYGEELALCERYYQVHRGFHLGMYGSSSNMMWKPRVPMAKKGTDITLGEYTQDPNFSRNCYSSSGNGSASNGTYAWNSSANRATADKGWIIHGQNATATTSNISYAPDLVLFFDAEL